MFQAILMVQGSANWIPHSHRSEVAILFPDSDMAKEVGLRSVGSEEEICRHHAVMQCRSQDLGLGVHGAWTTLDIAGHWVTFDAGGDAQALDIGKVELRGLADLETLVEQSGATFSLWNGSTDHARAGLVLRQGCIEPDADFEEEYRVRFGTEILQDNVLLSNVHRVELGQIDSLTLRMRRFGTQVDQTLDFAKPADSPDGRPGTLTVWIRHFCDLSRPDSNPPLAEMQGETRDLDFPLNYLFQRDVVQRVSSGFEPPFPEQRPSFEGDDPIGDETTRCVGTRVPAQNYDHLIP